ncbi:MAG: hypothetical protein ACREVK_07305, partial [Gammaproteobacteria bacterium]
LYRWARICVPAILAHSTTLPDMWPFGERYLVIDRVMIDARSWDLLGTKRLCPIDRSPRA